MSAVKNILFIMIDQLRWDYLSCNGHPYLHTPNIDALAKKGINFNRAYCQSPVCGPSRMSAYTGRYTRSHGSSWNDFPLSVGQKTMGEHLRENGVRTAQVGKTHVRADKEGMQRLGIDPQSEEGVLLAQGGFEPFERDDGFYHPNYPNDWPKYNDYLADLGYDGDNPWMDWANSGVDEQGNIVSGMFLKSAKYAARIKEEHSETPYITRRAIDFIEDAGDEAWCLHLSYIKPHWPIIAPEPYASMYGKGHMLPLVRNNEELKNAHPVFKAFTKRKVSKTFSRQEVLDANIPVYMGLVKQIDDQLGVLFQSLEDKALMDNTMIVFTSDHGDYLGDHWMGEKDLFHEPSVKVPLIIYDPSSEADATRGTVCEELVEQIDFIPTFVEAVGGKPNYNELEGRSLLNHIYGKSVDQWRKFVISEYDYSMMPIRLMVDLPVEDARLVMVSDKRWKFIHAEGFRPMLFDMQNDPYEFIDLGDDDNYQDVMNQFREYLLSWALKHHMTTTVRNEIIDKKCRGGAEKRGIFLGYWDETELPKAQ